MLLTMWTWSVIAERITISNCRQSGLLYTSNRIGHTVPFGEAGQVINLVGGDRSMQDLQMIQQHFADDVTKLDLDNPDQAI